MAGVGEERGRTVGTVGGQLFGDLDKVGAADHADDDLLAEVAQELLHLRCHALVERVVSMLSEAMQGWTYLPGERERAIDVEEHEDLGGTVGERRGHGRLGCVESRRRGQRAERERRLGYMVVGRGRVVDVEERGVGSRLHWSVASNGRYTWGPRTRLAVGPFKA